MQYLPILIGLTNRQASTAPYQELSGMTTYSTENFGLIARFRFYLENFGSIPVVSQLYRYLLDNILFQVIMHEFSVFFQNSSLVGCAKNADGKCQDV